MKVIRRADSRLELLEDLVVKTTRINKTITFKNDWLEIANGVITIKKKFHWNGCTWARDGRRNEDDIPISWIASAVHDALYNTSNLPDAISRKIIDLIFYDELKKINFDFKVFPDLNLLFMKTKPVYIPAAVPYYTFVRVFGGFFREKA